MPFPTKAFAAHQANECLKHFSFERRDVGPSDIHLQIKYCGVCHSDVHQAKSEWPECYFPMVPGHEIVGMAKQVGKDVTKFKPGDIVAVGCFVDSCRSCKECNTDEEQHCPKAVLTYNGFDHEKKPTYGGYSMDIVVAERFVFKIPDALKGSLAEAAPLLCAGITVWNPMMRHKMNRPGAKIGVVGLGGLGHMAVKFGVAFNAEVTVISTSPSKKDEAIKVLGAKNFVVSTDKEQMKKVAGTLDFMIDCVSAGKDMNAYLELLDTHGILVSVALPPQGYEWRLEPHQLVKKSKGIFGSHVAGIKATQEMLDFCGQEKITSTVEVIKMEDINEAFGRMLKSDVRYRFVIDIEASSFSKA